MKKRKILLLVIIVLLCAVVGFTAYPTIMNENMNDHSLDNTEEISSNETDDIIENSNNDIAKEIVSDNSTETIIQENSTSLSIETSKTEILSDEDKMVKVEIAKYIDTDIDFKFIKKEKVNGKEFHLTFSEIENVLENHEKIIYKNDLGDTFKFDAKNGKLCEFIIDSFVTEKNDKSIDKNSAQKIAVEYATTKYDIDDYKVYSYKETTKGYNFIYTKYIGGYPSSDKFSVKVGYDGNIVYANDFTDTFYGKELNYSKEFIDAKIKEATDETKVDWDSVRICIEEGKVSVSYTVPEQCAIAILPLE